MVYTRFQSRDPSPSPGFPPSENETQECDQSQITYVAKPNSQCVPTDQHETFLIAVFLASFETQSKKCVLVGESGVGKSSLINLMADHDVANISSGITPCTQETTHYYFTLSGQAPICILDTIGTNVSDSAMETVLELIRSLRNTGDIDLILLCVKARSLADSVEQVCYLISEASHNLCVPLALAVTHLEDENDTENWWKENEKAFGRYGIHPAAHACVTTALPHETSVEKRAQSKQALRALFDKALQVGTHDPSRTPAIHHWLVKIIKKAFLLLTRRKRRTTVRERLERDYSHPRDRAQRLAELVVE